MSIDFSVNSPIRGIGLALAGFSIFSLHDALIKSIDGVPVFQIVFFVVLFSFVPFVGLLALNSQEISLRPKLPGLVALRCVFTVGALLCVFYAFNTLPMTQVYSLLFSAPVLITLLSIPILGERVKLIRWIAILLGLAGIYIVLQPGKLALSSGHFAALAAATCTACTSVVTRKIGSREHSVTLLLYPMLANVLVSGGLLMLVYQPMPGVDLLKMCGIGLLSVIGQLLMINAYRSCEAQYVAPMQYSQMLWAIAYGALIFNETIDRHVVLGSSIIVISGLMVLWRELVASVTQPVLRTRNLRVAGGPQAISVESDKLGSIESVETADPGQPSLAEPRSRTTQTEPTDRNGPGEP